MRTLHFLLLGLGGLRLAAHAQQPGDYELRGQDARLAGQTLSLLAATRPSHAQAWPVLDSTQADAAGRFALRGRVPVADVYHLRVGHQPVLYPVPLIGQAERLTAQVQANPRRAATPFRLQLSGTPALTLLQATQLLVAPQGTVRSSAQRQRLATLLRANARSPLAPYLTYRYLLPDLPSRPLLDSLAQRFQREQPDSPYLARLRPVIASLALRQPAPDFTLPDAQGQPLTLSQLRGHYVLLDFWASWCAPCRAENPTLRAAYQRFRDRGPGLVVLSVSVDESPAAWQRAVAEDALPWAQLRAEDGVSGAIGRAFQLMGVPATTLLDPTGRLVATTLRGEALTRELARWLP